MRTVGRYELHDRIAAGGMAEVHYGRLVSDGGFSRIVAIKRLHPHLCQDESLRTMLVDEARLAARVVHPCVVPVIDVVELDELYLVMNYVPGESLARLCQLARARGERIAPALALGIAMDLLEGLHAAHTTRGEDGALLELVHRDVSPQNVLVGPDGVARLLDFGIAKARGRLQRTELGAIKGKLAYMAPEQLRGEHVDCRADVYAASVVLWEMLAGKRLFETADEAMLSRRLLDAAPASPMSGVASLDAVVLRGLAKDRGDRFETARDMTLALERVHGRAAASAVGDWVHDVAGEALVARAAEVERIERRLGGPCAVASVGPSSPSAAPMITVRTMVAGSRAPRPSAPTPTAALAPAAAAAPARWRESSRVRIAVAAAFAMTLTSLVAFAASWRSDDRGLAQTSATLAPVAPPSPPPSDTPLVGESASAAQPADPAADTAPKPLRSRRFKAPPTATGPRPSCDPPFFWDTDGGKHYRPECL